MMKFKHFTILFLLWASTAFGQVFTTLYLPTVRENPSSSLYIAVAAGRTFCGTSMVNYAGGTLLMTASTTNYVYLNTASSCALSVKTTTFVLGDIPIASVVAGSSTITSVTDQRSMFSKLPLMISTTWGSITGTLSSQTDLQSALNLKAGFPPAGLAKSSGSGWTTPSFSDVVSLWAGGSCASGYLAFDGTCSTPSGSGVQYNASNTLYLWGGPDSIVGDDAGAFLKGSPIPVTSWNITGGVCSFTNSGTNGLSVGEWFTPDQVTGFPAVPSPYAPWTTGYDLFQVSGTGLSTTTWQAACPLLSNTSGSGGNAENANYFLPFYPKPFIDGHGSIQVALPVGSTLASLVTNYSTTLHPLISAWHTANPSATIFVLLTGGRNDIQACMSASTMEGDWQTVWGDLHSEGSYVKVIQASITPSGWNTSNGSCPTAFTTMNTVNEWMRGQSVNNSLAGSGHYVDRFIDVYSILNNLQDSQIYNSGNNLNGAGIAKYANLINEEMSTQGTAQRGYPSGLIPGPWGGGIAPTADGYAWHPPFVDSTHAFAFWNHAGTNEIFYIDSTNGRVYSQGMIPSVTGGLVTVDSTTGYLHSTQKGPAGSGAGYTTGPNSGTTASHITTYSDTAGTTQDSGVLITAIPAADIAAGSLANGMTATTQSPGDNSTKLATTAFVTAAGSGTTTNALTANSSGGAAAGSTFNGSAPVTFDYHSFGAAPTASPTLTGAVDASGATSEKLPVGAGCATTANGMICYDSTNKNWHLWKNGADSLLIPFPASPTSGDCYEPVLSTGVWSMVDAGGPCGISGGGVTSWSGDGALYTNSSSTGGVAAALGNAAAHKFWGNNTGSSTTPGYQSIGAQDVTPNMYAAGGGTANAQTVTLSPAATSLVAGLTVRWLPTAANTGAATLAVNGLTAKSITKCGTTALVANDLTTAAVAIATYDGTQFQLVNPQATGCGVVSSSLPTFVQYTFVAETGGSTASITSPSITVTNGNLIVAACRYAGSGAATGSTASGSSVTTWHLLTTNATSSVGVQLSWGMVTSTGATTFTCTPSSSSSGQSMVILEFTGTGTTANGNTGDTGTTPGTFGGWVTNGVANIATTQRVLAVMCSSVNSTANVFYPIAWINSIQVQGVMGVSAATMGTNHDMGCYSTIIPAATPGTKGEWTYGGSGPSSSASSVVYINY